MSVNNIPIQSVWKSAGTQSFDISKLTPGEQVDVVIIGAGITGISTAFILASRGMKVIVVDSGSTGSGTTGNSTGNLYVPTGQFHTILSKHGKKVLAAVAASRISAIRFIEDRIKEFKIDCGFKRVPWMYFTSSGQDVSEIEKERDAIREAGIETLHTVPDGFYFPSLAVARVDSQAQFNPFQYITGFANAISNDNCRIFINTRVTDIVDGNPCIVETSAGTIRASRVVQATHTPKGIYGVHALMEVYREYAIAARLHGKYPEGGIYWMRQGKDIYSIRSYTRGSDSYIIVLDDSAKTGHRENTELSFEKIEEFARSFFNISEISYRWAAQNYSPADKLPFIGTSPLQKNIYIATGFAADGLVYGTVAALIISDMIAGIHNEWSEVFDPKRFTPIASAKNAARENFDVISQLVKGLFIRGEEKEYSVISKGEASIIDFNNEKTAAFRDGEGRLHVVSAKCPHMGCVVKWNNAEESWDCPCHGSRFSKSGELVEGPALRDLDKYTNS